jgi:hypothetical protein
MRAITVLCFFTVFLPAAQGAQLGDILKQAEGALHSPQGSQLSDSKITAGLKQALQISTSRAVANAGRPDGFWKNQAVKILLPEKLRTVGRGMRLLGMGSQVDDLELGMNRAAEQASPQAKAIFLSSLEKMSFADARRILTGGNTAATEYFKSASSTELSTFSPIVHQAMQRVGVVKKYNTMLNSAPEGPALAGRFDLDKYVVGKTLDGLFYMLGQEETAIRKNPAAQTTALLKEVFAHR